MRARGQRQQILKLQSADLLVISNVPNQTRSIKACQMSLKDLMPGLETSKRQMLGLQSLYLVMMRILESQILSLSVPQQGTESRKQAGPRAENLLGGQFGEAGVYGA